MKGLATEVLIAEHTERLLSLEQRCLDPVDATAVRRREPGEENLAGAERIVVGHFRGDDLVVEQDLELLVLVHDGAERLGVENGHWRADRDPFAALTRLDEDVRAVVRPLRRHVVPGALRGKPVSQAEADLVAEDDVLRTLEHIADWVSHVADHDRLAVASGQDCRDAVIVRRHTGEEDVALGIAGLGGDRLGGGQEREGEPAGPLGAGGDKVGGGSGAGRAVVGGDGDVGARRVGRVRDHALVIAGSFRDLSSCFLGPSRDVVDPALDVLIRLGGESCGSACDRWLDDFPEAVPDGERARDQFRGVGRHRSDR